LRLKEPMFTAAFVRPRCGAAFRAHQEREAHLKESWPRTRSMGDAAAGRIFIMPP
jgi:hypothetical protein